MGVFITLVSLGIFLLMMGIYKICQTTFLQNDKSRMEEKGFLSDSLLSFLEFSILVVTFLFVESMFIGLENGLWMKGLFIFACFCLFVIDDILLYKKQKK